MPAMTNVSRSWCWAATIFGWLGMVLCLAGLVFVWGTSSRTRASVDRVATKLLGLTSEVHERSLQAMDWVGESQNMVIALEDELRSGLAGALEERGVDPARLVGLAEQLRGLSPKVRNWAAAAESTRDLVELFAEVLESLGLVIGASDKEEWRDALASGLGQVGEATEAIDQLADALQTAQAEPGIPPSTYQPLLQRFAATLGKLLLTTTQFTDRIAAIEESAEEIQGRIKQRLWLWSLVATALLVWAGVGQYALAQWGRRKLAGSDPGEG